MHSSETLTLFEPGRNCQANLMSRNFTRSKKIILSVMTVNPQKCIYLDGSVNIHQRNLRCLAMKNKLSPPFICDLVNELDESYL